MKKRYSLLAFIALVIGVLLGIFAKDFTASIEFIGTYYIKFLKLLITPAIFTSIACTIYKTKKEKTNILFRCISLFVIMYIATFLITSLLVLIINPSNNYVIEDVVWNGEITKFELKTFLLNLLPKNLSDIFINPKVFFIIVIAYLFGRFMPSEKVINVVEKIKSYVYIVLEYLTYISPIAIVSLMASTVSKNGAILLGVGLKYILTAYFCSLVCVALVMILPVCIACKISPIAYFKKIYKIWTITITTCSSAATLPYTVKLCNEELNIPKKVTDIVVPLGCTIHMCGGAVSFALLGLFCSKMYGVPINIGLYLLMIISSLLINMAAPGIPNGGIVIGATYLSLLGIPLNFIGFYSGIYKLLDMCYTTLNVTGDISANMLINKQINED